MIKVAGAITAAWLLIWGVYVIQHFDVECLLYDCAAPKRFLKPNELGDFLAGSFAPLAFLWLFVATMLQRQELALQRKELQETREVLALQKAELSRAADENSQQTAIMKQNLENEAKQLEYDRADAFLYSTALFIFTNRDGYVLKRGSDDHHAAISAGALSSLSITKENSDLLYAVLYLEMKRTRQRLADGTRLAYFQEEQRTLFAETRSRLAGIAVGSEGNELVEARLHGLNFYMISNTFSELVNEIQ